MQVRQTDVYRQWFDALRDRQASSRIIARIRRLAEGNPGQHRMLRSGVGEMKIDYGPGYRIYYTERDGAVIVLLCGGDKSTQQDDIRAAEALSRSFDQ
jgi:putative addiction module killer protein